MVFLSCNNLKIVLQSRYFALTSMILCAVDVLRDRWSARYAYGHASPPDATMGAGGCRNVSETVTLKNRESGTKIGFRELKPILRRPRRLVERPPQYAPWVPIAIKQAPIISNGGLRVSGV